MNVICRKDEVVSLEQRKVISFSKNEGQEVKVGGREIELEIGAEPEIQLCLLLCSPWCMRQDRKMSVKDQE